MTRRKFTAVRAAQITAHSEFSFGERTDKRREKSALATAQKPFVYINQNLHAGDLIDSFWVIYEFMFAYDKNQSETLFSLEFMCTFIWLSPFKCCTWTHDGGKDLWY